MRIRMRVLAGSIAAAAAVGGPALFLAARPTGASPPWATAALRTADGSPIGSVSFRSDGTRTAVTAQLRRVGATALDAFHGLHIHANDDPVNGDGCVADATLPSSTWFVSADGHWKHDPAELHGNHAGDLPSVFVNADGSVSLRVVVDKLTPAEVIGRAVVLHAGPDNFGNVPVGPADDQYTPGPSALAKTQATGNASDRIACGVITG